MATVFKTFLNDDIATTRTLLHEAIPIHGGILFGTYAEPLPENQETTNIKNYPHKMFQSVYDYPYLSSSANHIFDLTLGLSADSDALNPDDVSAAKKQRIYQQMAQVLVGHDTVGNILKFDEDGNILEGGDKFDEVLVISAARLLNKDEIKKGSCHLHLNVSRGTPIHPEDETEETAEDERTVLFISDEGSANDYRVNSPAGDYGILRCREIHLFTADEDTGVLDLEVPESSKIYSNTDASSSATVLSEIDEKCGLIYYQAGVIVLSPSVFEMHDADSNPSGKLPIMKDGLTPEEPVMYIKDADTPDAVTYNMSMLMQQEDIPTACDSLRKRIDRLAFNNTTELNSTIYFCRINHNDFNYSSNPTYLQESKIRVKESTEDAPISYISTVGLYSADNELLAVAKLSEVLRKDPTNEMTLRVRLDY